MSQKRFENFPKALPSKQRASIFTVVKGEVVTQRAKPLTIVKILAMTAGRERPKEYLMNLKLRQICVHLIGGDTRQSRSIRFRLGAYGGRNFISTRDFFRNSLTRFER